MLQLLRPAVVPLWCKKFLYIVVTNVVVVGVDNDDDDLAVNTTAVMIINIIITMNLSIIDE